MAKKFLYIIEGNLTSGSGKCAWELINLLLQDNEFTPIVLTQYRNNLNDACNSIGIENYSFHYARSCSLGMGIIGWLIAFFARPLLNFIAYKKLSSRINLNDLCLIHSNSSSIDFGAYLYKKTNIPHVWHVREFLVFNRTWHSLIWNLPSYISRYSTRTITVSNALKDYCINRKADENRIVTIHDGVSGKSFVSRTNTLQEGKIKIVCVGNFAPIKGQNVIIEAIHLIDKEDLNYIQVDLFGSDDIKFADTLKALISRYNLENIISIHDFEKNIQQKLSNYDIGIQPSHTEGFSRVTVEYMFAGLCVIATTETSNNEPIFHNQNGLLYHSRKPQELANLLSYYVHNKKRLVELGNKAQQDAIENYCIENNYKKIIDVYNAALSEKC